jgi:hypothetical protein
MTMKRLLLELACVAAFGGMAASAQAQQNGSPPSPTPAGPPTSASQIDKKTQVDDAYRAAQAKCETYTERKRSDCMRDAEEKYNQSFMHGTGVAGGGNPGGTSGPVTAKD